ncbi:MULTISPECIES: SAM-dependent methyltransferase [Pseudofrankia]|uniref:SAM-dependent methyltransferase n=1 Tax=Pseudofrankia TaxID=2994363 RepID=UPI00055B5FEE|nr:MULTISPECIES: SAM-dependent methyltransferase [Pseudofrankia]
MATSSRQPVPHPARMYDYYLGGKDNYPADREAAEKPLAVLPNARIVAAEGRAFMHRTTRYLAREAGIRQFLDIGTGIPTSPNLHEVAQAIAPDARVLYVDNDPSVLTHARALLTGTSIGRTAYLDADLRQPEKILGSAELADTLDLSKPVALSLIGIFHFIPDTDDPYGLIRAYLDALPSGSYLTLSQFTADLAPEEAARAAEVYHRSGLPAVARSREQIARFFDGLEPVDPGVALIHRWRPDEAGTADEPTDAQVSAYGALARKP